MTTQNETTTTTETTTETQVISTQEQLFDYLSSVVDFSSRKGKKVNRSKETETSSCE